MLTSLPLTWNHAGLPPGRYALQGIVQEGPGAYRAANLVVLDVQ